MDLKFKNIFFYIVTISIVTMFFSCDTKLNEVRKFSKSSFVPSGEADDFVLKYTDSGKIKSVLTSDKMLDYGNIKNPFTEFPNGIHVLMYDEKGAITTIVADYAISYKKTDIIDLQGNVLIDSEGGKKLETQQLYFDQKNEWFFTEKQFKYTDGLGGFLSGPGVDFSKDFKVFNMQKSSGEVNNLN